MSALSTYKKVNEFLGDIADAIKDTPWPTALARALPWTGVIGEALADTVAPIKFVYKMYQTVTEVTDQDQLGEIACTFAFQRSVEQALRSQMMDLPELKNLHVEWQKDTTDRKYDFSTFRLDSARTHPFYIESERQFKDFCDAMHWPTDRNAKMVTQVRSRFCPNLRVAITHKDGYEKFEAFRELIQLPDSDANIRALQQHSDFQRWKFEEGRVLNIEPFAIQHVYVDSDCGVLNFADLDTIVDDCAPRDPFDESEANGGRHSLMDTTLALIANQNFKDAIIVQGYAGSGKSTFTLRLCKELQDQGVSPIRIELKRIDATKANRDIVEILEEAVRLADEDYNPHSLGACNFKNDLFDNNSIFNESVDFEFRGQTATISQYALILDAWDEISVGAEEGYQQLVERLLADVRRKYLSSGDRSFPIRVILCGRPSDAITHGSHFPIKDTKLLTVRPFTPHQCQGFASKLTACLRHQPLEASSGWQAWEMPTADRMSKVFEHYEKQLDAENRSDVSLEVLGMPLLSLLAFRLMAEWGDRSLTLLFENTTLLYRCLVDQLLAGAKTLHTADEATHIAHFRGDKLRELLRDTAEFISILGEESISRKELAFRLQEKSDESSSELSELVERLGTEVYTRLMISFFFKPSSENEGNQNLGCEFTHKSFREYLFAEQIVESLKEFGKGEHPVPPLNLDKYWADFSDDDPRQKLSRRLLNMLGPQRLTTEVAEKLSQQIGWEITRTMAGDPYCHSDGAQTIGEQTEPLTEQQWVRVRDALADLWNWWAEGVPLRPSVKKERAGHWSFEEPLVSMTATRCRKLSTDIQHTKPVRVITVDSHIGDALFQLCAEVHQWILRCQLLELQTHKLDWSTRAKHDERVNPYQTVLNMKKSNGDLVRLTTFSPGSTHSLRNKLQLPTLDTYVDRINGSGFRSIKRWGNFPADISMRSLDLNGFLAQSVAPHIGTSFFGANLVNSRFSGGAWQLSDFRCADLTFSIISGTTIDQVQFDEANLTEAAFSNCIGVQPYFENAILQRAIIRDCRFVAAKFEGAQLSSASVANSSFTSADFSSASLNAISVSGSSFRRANFSDAHFSNANFKDVDLTEAILLNADLRNADFSDVNFDRCVINANTKWDNANVDVTALKTARFLDDEGSLNDQLRDEFLADMGYN